jgi:hypothetical protein
VDLLDDRTMGWRLFATRPERVSWVRLRRHLDAMPGGALVDVACDRMTEAALVFTYRGHRFGVDLHDGSFRFNVGDPACPDDVLREVLAYADAMLAPTRGSAGLTGPHVPGTPR